MKSSYRQRFLHLGTVALCAALLLLIFVLPASADENLNLEVEVTFEYDLARAGFQLVNDFRAGKVEGGAWQWNEDNQSKTILTDLQPLTYDYGLEKIAMQRAAECAVFYSHTRPNGSTCMTIYPTYGASGENIAAGQTSANEVYLDWREDDEDYAGQGHRRNMLESRFSSIGIGCVRANGRLYWCQAFYSGTTGQAETLSSPIVIEANPATVKVTSAKSLAESISIQEGASDDPPKISATFNNNFTSVDAVILNPSWQSEGSQIAVENGKITGATGGKTSLFWQLGNCSVSLPATVICSVHTDEIIPAVEPNCTETGLTEGTQCSVCGTVTKEQTVVAAKGHTPVVDPRKEPTLTETGLTEGSHCEVCGTVLVAQEKIPKLNPPEKEVKVKIQGLELTGKKNQIKVEWDKLSSKDLKKIKKIKNIKIQVQVSTDKNFENDVTTKTVKTSKSSVTVKGLKKGKKYYVRVRLYGEDGGTQYYSKWTKKNIKLKKK